MKMHPWHDIDLSTEASDTFNAIIEIPKNSRAKYELDKVSGLLRMDRVLYSAMYYPTNYGFIPQTLSEDGDPLDILVFSQIAVEPLCIVEATIIGAFKMLDEGKADDKIIAVAKNDMSVNHVKDASQLAEHYHREIKNFFEEYKKLENKKVLVNELLGKEEALKIISSDRKNYIEQYKSK
jgi:inorganic pyrophosphatase